MRPADHFFSLLTALERAGPPGEGLSAHDKSRIAREFSRLITPVIGASAGEDLFYHTLEKAGNQFLRKIGAMAAFFLGEYDDSGMALEDDDWREIRETLEDVSEEIDIKTLTALMGGLLSRGKM
ncbi:MAG: hypothetical protein LBT95_01540 [Treponema sp.]|jgi:hypothetical protein|nr:hypothetical protein [Treponema sp.]